MNSISLNSVLQALRILPAAHIPEGKTHQPSSDFQTLVPAAPLSTSLPEISLQMVAEHDSHDDCWIIVYDRVYDVTLFLAEHPGGKDIILDYAGHDATLAFHGTGHSRAAIQQMSNYVIGELPPHERIFRTKYSQVLLKGVPE